MEWLKPSEGCTLRSLVRQLCISARTLLASTLPSSTPHWSKELMPHTKPCAGQRRMHGGVSPCSCFLSQPQPQQDGPLLRRLTTSCIASRLPCPVR